MNQTLYSIREVARILRVQPYQIAYLLDNNRVPEPRVRLGNRRAFAAWDIRRLAAKFGVKIPDEFTEETEDQHG